MATAGCGALIHPKPQDRMLPNPRQPLTRLTSVLTAS